MEERGSLPSRRGKTDHFPSPPSIGGAPFHRRFGLPFTVRTGEESIAFDGRRTTIGFERASGGACLTSDRIGAEVEGGGEGEGGGAETIIGGAGTKEREET